MHLFWVLFLSFLFWGWCEENVPHIHWWNPVQRRYETALGCRCGILAMFHFNDELAIATCKEMNKRMLLGLLNFKVKEESWQKKKISSK
jgi:hypothetical protein